MLVRGGAEHSYSVKSGKDCDPMTVSREEMAATIHKARWPADRALAATPFEDEDRNGREYCFRIADAVLAALRSQGGKAEPDAWLVGWHSANGDAGTSVYTTEDEARRAAKNMEAYRSSETMTDVLPLYAAPLPSPPGSAEAPEMCWHTEGMKEEIVLTLDKLCVVEADLGLLRNAVAEAIELLVERKHGNPARSPGHNARLILERALGPSDRTSSISRDAQQGAAE